jgi:hypothetical protein
MADMSPENSNFDAKLDALRELPTTENDPRFEPHELIACSSCSRSNPPNRTACLYCGKPFEAGSVRTDLARINYQRPETWEDGFSLVFAGKGELSNEVIEFAADLLQTDVDSLKRILNISVPIPLIYLRSLPDAGLLASRLSQVGFGCALVGDDLLQSKVPPTRVRSIKFEDESAFLEGFNTGRTTPVGFDEKALFVTGSLLRTSTEVAGKISKKAMKDVKETHGVVDEAVIDIYPASDVYGFRIRSSGFDFSCLGEKMQRFVGANMSELTGLLRARFRSAVFIDTFSTAASLISLSWPLDEIRQASSVTRGPLGGVYKQTLTVLDNTDQFTRFSRLQRHFV